MLIYYLAKKMIHMAALEIMLLDEKVGYRLLVWICNVI
jgi:hypothetical protein